MPKRLKDQQRTIETIDNQRQQHLTGSLGVIVEYNRYDNTAVVVISKNDTDEINDIIRAVPCPTIMGVQTTVPEPGRMCWVIFKNGNVTQPLISHFYNPRYSEYDYQKQATTPMNIPNHLIG